MADIVGALATAGLCVGAYIVWDEAQREKQAVQVQVTYPQPQPQPSKTNPVLPIFGAALDMIFGGMGTKNTSTGQGGYSGDTLTPQPQIQGSAPVGLEAALLGLIGSIEAPQGYDQVYGGIRPSDYPPRRLTSMTVGEVLNWQDSIDPRYQSEAAGRYQILEDTLRGLANGGHIRHSDRFDRRNQDRLGVALLERRGLRKYQAGKISATQFGQNLSQEWASLPAMTKDKNGNKAKGQSYYANDGLNHALTSQHAVMNILTGGGFA